MALALAMASSGPSSQAWAAVGNVSKDWTPEKVSSTSDEGKLLRKLEKLRSAHQQRAQEGYGVVQVITRPGSARIGKGPGTIVASGTLVFLDQEPVVLTNSHVLAGRESAEVEFPLFHFSVAAKRILDVPVADIALLRLDIPKAGIESQKWHYAHAGAFMNLRFCSPKDTSCEAGIHYFSRMNFSITEEVICAVVDARPVCTKNTAPWQSITVPDTVVSGIYSHMLQIPTFARPGMSGGAYYASGRLEALLSKVDLGLGSFAYAIPIYQVARVIGQKYFGLPNGMTIPEARWIGDAASPLLEVRIGDEVVISSPRSGSAVSAGGEAGNSGGEAGNSGGEAGNSGGEAGNSGGEAGNSGGEAGNSGGEAGNSGGEAGNSGGEAGNSGGEAGNSGGEAGNSGGEAGNSGGEAGNSGGHPSLQRYWKLLIRMFGGEQTVRASNPFFAKPHDVRVNGRKLLALEFPHERAPEKRILLSPSTPAYLWARLNGTRHGFSWKRLWDTPEDRQSLIERRKKSSVRPSHARIYQLRAGVFEQDRSRGDDLFQSGAVDLRNNRSSSPYRAQWGEIDSLLTVTVSPSRENLAIRVDRGLDEILINAADQDLSLRLQRITPLEAPTLLYCVQDSKTGRCRSGNPYRASISWSRYDLGRLDRILITTPEYLHEFVSCRVGQIGDCVR
jgi:hypothetical protein